MFISWNCFSWLCSSGKSFMIFIPVNTNCAVSILLCQRLDEAKRQRNSSKQLLSVYFVEFHCVPQVCSIFILQVFKWPSRLSICVVFCSHFICPFPSPPSLKWLIILLFQQNTVQLRSKLTPLSLWLGYSPSLFSFSKVLRRAAKDSRSEFVEQRYKAEIQPNNKVMSAHLEVTKVTICCIQTFSMCVPVSTSADRENKHAAPSCWPPSRKTRSTDRDHPAADRIWIMQ